MKSPSWHPCLSFKRRMIVRRCFSLRSFLFSRFFAISLGLRAYRHRTNYAEAMSGCPSPCGTPAKLPRQFFYTGLGGLHTKRENLANNSAQAPSQSENADTKEDQLHSPCSDPHLVPVFLGLDPSSTPAPASFSRPTTQGERRSSRDRGAPREIRNVEIAWGVEKDQ